MAIKTVKITVMELDEKGVGETRKKEPKIGVKTADKWVSVRGQKVGEIQKGDTLVVTEPTQFGKSWYAELKGIESSFKDTPFESQQTSSNGAPSQMHLYDYGRVMRYLHGVAKELEPDEALSRSALVNTGMIAVIDKKVDISDCDVPEPGTDDGEPPF